MSFNEPFEAEDVEALKLQYAVILHMRRWSDLETVLSVLLHRILSIKLSFPRNFVFHG